MSMKKRILLLIFVILTFLIGIIIIENKIIEKRYIKLSSNGIKILQISDVHKSYSDSKIIEKYLIDEKPNIVVLTGDIIDNKNNLQLLEKFLACLDQVKAEKYSIPGNWEYWSGTNIEELKVIYKKHSIKLLINEGENIKINGRNVAIFGFDDLLSGNPKIKAFNKFCENSMYDFLITLKHEPFKNSELIQKSTIILSGHSHGGQISIFGIAPFLPKGCDGLTKGLYPKLKLNVSSGIGNSILPFRIFVKKEICIIT